MGGGGLSFLNKKTWHPARLDRQEDKWKREQAALKEKQKAEELKKQILEEREREELDGLAHAAGIKQKSEQMDWMYQGGMVAKAEANKRVKEQQAAQPAHPSNVEKVVKMPTFYAEDTAASANEVWSRLHSDPLFAIKQQEIAARRSIASNPVQMDAIRKQVEKRKAAEGAAKAAKKAEKRAKKDAKRAEKAERKVKKHAASGRQASEDAEAEDVHKSKKHRPSSQADHEDRDGSKAHHHKHADDAGRKHHSDRGRENGRGHNANGHSRHREAERPHAHIDGACAQRGDIKYGLNYGGDAPDDDARRERRAATQRNLEEAAKRKAEEEWEKAAQRYVRKEYKPGQLSAEERAQRLAEMTGNATVHDEARWSRQRRAREQDDEEAVANERRAADDRERHASKAATFLKSATQETYGAAGEARSLADTVGRRKYYSERGGGH